MPNYILTCATFDTPEIAEMVEKILIDDIDENDHEMLDFIVTPKEWEKERSEWVKIWEDEEIVKEREYEYKQDYAWKKCRQCFEHLGRLYEFWDFTDTNDRYGGEVLHLDGCKLWTCHGWHPYYAFFEDLSRTLNIHIILDVDVKRSEWWDNENDPEHVEYNTH